jgi:hypothetical protein
MHNSLVAVVDRLLAFATKHAKGVLDPSALLTEDQIAELTTLDTEFYARCQLDGLPLSIISEPQDPGLRGFGNSKLPYALCTVHVPIKDEDGTITREMRGSGMMIILTPEWIHTMKSLRATAEALKAKAEDRGKMPSTNAESSQGGEAKWMPVSEAVNKANEKGYNITPTWLTRDAAKHGVKVRPRLLAGNHKKEVEWNSLSGYLLENWTPAPRPAKEQDDQSSIDQRIQLARQRKQKERPLD